MIYPSDDAYGMWRKAYDLLLEWKDREDRMPLIVRGVRQCGKTYILRRFGEEQYGNMVYVNLESERGMHRVFDRDLDPNCPDIRTDEEYGRVLNMCQNLGFQPLVSTPMFEFWLLLHHESVDVTAYGPSLLYKNDILRDLESLEGGRSKGISQRRFDRFYLGTFPRAVDASRTPPLTTDPRRLVDTPGTNVGVELESLLS